LKILVLSKRKEKKENSINKMGLIKHIYQDGRCNQDKLIITININGINCPIKNGDYKNRFLKILLLYWGHIVTFTQFLQCVIVEFTPSIIPE
jgi:hypothetical protein